MTKILLLLMFCTFSTAAQIPEGVKKEIDLRVKHEINPSIVVGVYENGQSHFYTQGLQDRSKDIKASIDSVYEIGSISKTFTGLLLAHLIEEEVVELDGAVQNYWPQPFSLLDSQDQPITLKQLSTHTSGLPRLPDNLPTSSNDPYADYDRAQLLIGIEQAEIKKANHNYVYSNFAVGLLGETLAVVTGQTYNDLIKQNILKPMSLNSTYMSIDEVPNKHLVQGYMENVPTSPWKFKALGAAGSIRSSIKDLLTYGVAYLNPQSEKLKKSTQLATTLHFKKGTKKVALGWHWNASDILTHNGATAGFKSIIMIDPKNKKVVAGMTNHNKSIADIVTHLMNPRIKMTQYQYPKSINDDHLLIYTGHYQEKNSDKTIEIKLFKNNLYYSAPKQAKKLMTFYGKDTFKNDLFKIQFKFKKNAAGDINQIELTSLSGSKTYLKKTDTRN